MKRFICWLLGHSLSNDSWNGDRPQAKCRRCGQVFDGAECK